MIDIDTGFRMSREDVRVIQELKGMGEFYVRHISLSAEAVAIGDRENVM